MLLEEIKRKILEGNMDSKEWEALEEAERECALTAALTEAITTETTTRKKQQNGRLTAGALFPDEKKPPEGAEVLLPAGYAIAPEGLYRTEITEIVSNKTKTKKDCKLKVTVKRLTRTPFFISAVDRTGRVQVLLRTREEEWYGEWVALSRLTPNRL